VPKNRIVESDSERGVARSKYAHGEERLIRHARAEVESTRRHSQAAQLPTPRSTPGQSGGIQCFFCNTVSAPSTMW
jgi:hypothetical protein